MDPYMDLVWIPIDPHMDPYMDPYMNPIQIQAARVQKCITVVDLCIEGPKMCSYRQTQAARGQKCLTVVRFMYHSTINGDFANGFLQFTISVAVITTQNSREGSP